LRTIVLFHRILISAGIAFCVFLGVHQLGVYRREPATLPLVIAAGCVVGAVGLAIYLATLRRHLHLD
jgi:hypothetical protein